MGQELYQKAIRPADTPLELRAIEDLRLKLTRDTRSFLQHDLGAGQKNRPQAWRKVRVKQLAQSGATRGRKGSLLAALAAFKPAERVLELGTQLGISAAYLASGMAPQGILYSIEGDPTLHAMAQTHLDQLGLIQRCRLWQGDFERVLNTQLSLTDFQPDLVYLDGNHRKEPSLQYFDLIHPHLTEGGLIILDDIHWSPEMQAAWKDLKNRPEVQMSIEVWPLGILMLGSGSPREHLVLR
ncbi:MAG: class I SAM-dependent methyltransferase [Bacteroidota bacterium]